MSNNDYIKFKVDKNRIHSKQDNSITLLTSPIKGKFVVLPLKYKNGKDFNIVDIKDNFLIVKSPRWFFDKNKDVIQTVEKFELIND